MTLQPSRHDISIGPRPRPLRAALRAVALVVGTLVVGALAIAIAALVTAA